MAIIMATPLGQGWFPQGIKARWVKGWGVRGGSGLTPRTGPTPPSPCEASGCRAAQTRCSGPWWDPSASSGWDLLCTHGPRGPAWRLFTASAWGWVRLPAAWPVSGCQGPPTGNGGRKQSRPLGWRSQGPEVGRVSSHCDAGCLKPARVYETTPLRSKGHLAECRAEKPGGWPQWPWGHTGWASRPGAAVQLCALVSSPVTGARTP